MTAPDVERRFLLRHMPDLRWSNLKDPLKFREGFLCIGERGNEVVLTEYTGTLNVKEHFLTAWRTDEPGDFLFGKLSANRTELLASQFNDLWVLTSKRVVNHERVTGWDARNDPCQVRVEVDFYPDLSGLIIARIWFDRRDVADKYVPMDGFQEITGDVRYDHRNLAVHGRPTETEP